MRVSLRKLLLAAVLACAPAATLAQDAHAGSDALALAYEEFSRLFAAGQFAEALPPAQRVVALIEAADPHDPELPVAYNNLGVAQIRVGDLDAAEASFNKALELLENRVGIVSRRLIAPLSGLSAVHAARGNRALAADTLQRALAISRRANGLFNIEQMELLDSLIDNYEAAGNTVGVESERRYAVRVLQQEYGASDPRIIPAVMRLAEWYESSGQYVLARGEWQRIVTVASQEGGGRNAATILGLVGIARNHRLQFVRDPESVQTAQVPIDPWTGRPDPFMEQALRTGTAKLERDGEAAALRALEILDQTPDPPPNLLAMTLVETGDWYMTAGRTDRALTYYRRAWPLFVAQVAAGHPNPLATPRALLYRPPPAAWLARGRTDVEVTATPIEFAMSINAAGETGNVTSLSVDVDPYRVAQVQRSLSRATFSPRFEDGAPVATDDFRFTEYWYDAVTGPSSPAPAGPEAQPGPEAEPPPS